MNDSPIVQANGKPFKKEVLAQELAQPTLTGVRNPWMSESMTGGLSPHRLAGILQNANQGDDYDFLTLAEEMEEREAHYASVLATRKLAIEALPINVIAGGEDAKAAEIAEDVKQLIERPEFECLLSDLLDGLGKGRSTVEIVWETGSKFTPKEYIWRDPRYFKLHPKNPKELRLIDEEELYKGLELAPYKFISHIPKIKSGIISRSGLARLVAVSYMCKSFALSDWMAFIELFGLPIRMGKYGHGAKEDDIKILKQAVASIGSDAAAVIPESMQLEFQEVANAGQGNDVFMKLAEWLDKQISKAVLGQTATTEGTPGKLGNEDAQSEVREDLLKADAKQLTRTVNEDLVKPYVDLNYGPQENYPKVQLYVKDPENLQLMVTAVEKLVPQGFKVKQSDIRTKLNFTEPEEGDELFEAPQAVAPTNQPDDPSTNTDLNHAHQCGSCGSTLSTGHAPHKHLNMEDKQDDIDELTDTALDGWEKVMKPLVDPIQTLARNSKTAEEFIERLPELLEDTGKNKGMDPTELVKSLASHAFMAKALGDKE